VLALLAVPATAAAPSSALAGAGGAASPTAAATGGVAPTRAAVRRVSLATWFGPGFYGRTTACGQTLTPSSLGVANRTLPCGTLVKVSYRGRRLVVPVIDRGPFANGADWDLTSEAARVLGVLDTVRVSVRVVGSVPNTPLLGLPAESAPGSVATPPSSPGTPAPPAAAITVLATVSGGAAAR
jgi:rare lipoprotein A